MSVNGTFRTSPDVRLESGMRTKADFACVPSNDPAHRRVLAILHLDPMPRHAAAIWRSRVNIGTNQVRVLLMTCVDQDEMRFALISASPPRKAVCHGCAQNA